MRKNVAVAGGVVLALAAGASAEPVFGTTLDGFLVRWDSRSPGTVQAGVPIQGLAGNETVVGLDVRPATGELYAMGSFSRVYKIDPASGQATPVAGNFTPALNGSAFGMDFNPVVDRIRHVSNADQNLRLHPDTGAVVFNDGELRYAAGDVNAGANPNAVHAAYTNNFAGTPTTTLYIVDSGLDVLAIQSPPNDGVLTTVGSLGTDVTEMGGFDVSGQTGVAYLTIRDAFLARSTFWRVNLTTGRAVSVGEIGGGAIITAMTVVPAPGAAGLGLAGLLVATRRRR